VPWQLDNYKHTHCVSHISTNTTFSFIIKLSAKCFTAKYNATIENDSERRGSWILHFTSSNYTQWALNSEHHTNTQEGGLSPFALETASTFCGIDSTRCWKHAFEILVVVVITSFLQIRQLHIHVANLLFYQIPKVMYWIQIWWLRRLKWTHCHVHETSWRLLLCDMMRYV